MYLLPALYFVDNASLAFPGCLSPVGSDTLTCAGESISPILPLDPSLLKDYSAEVLGQALRFRQTQADSVEVTLALPDRTPITQSYRLKPEHALPQVPIVELWPNFTAPGWQDYYGYYSDAGYGSETFQLRFPNAIESTQYQDTVCAIHKWVQLKSFPASLECTNSDDQPIGLLLLKPPPDLNPIREWKVGVAIHEDHTNIYTCSANGVQQPLPLNSDPSLHLQVTDSDSLVRITALLDYFIPASFFPLDEPLPLYNRLTTRGVEATSTADRPAILGGRIYNPSARSLGESVPWIETDIGVAGNPASTSLFLRNLALLISAIAVSQDVQEITWAISYPETTSRRQQQQYLQLWQTISQELSPRTGLTYHCPTSLTEPDFCLESVAVARYISSIEGGSLSYTTIIYLGQHTSTIAIWEGHLIDQITLPLAQQQLLFNPLWRNLEFSSQLLGNSFTSHQSRKRFDARLKLWLQWESEKWLQQHRAGLQNFKETQGLIQIIAVGLAGLYYYIGSRLQKLHEQGRYREGEITPVYIAGPGGTCLHWLDNSGPFKPHSEVNRLLSAMLSLGSGFEDYFASTDLCQHLNHEIAHGLVIEPRRQSLVKSQIPSPLSISPSSSPDHADGEIISQLAHFLLGFHQALHIHLIEGIEPIEVYTPSPHIADNEKLWRAIAGEMRNIRSEYIASMGKEGSISEQEPFISIGLMALINYLTHQYQWA